MTHNLANLSPQDQRANQRDIKAAMLANKIMTNKASKQKVMAGIDKIKNPDKANHMRERVEHYLNKGLITAEHYEPKIDESLSRVRQAVNKPTKTYTSGSKDGLWSTEVSKR